MLSCERRLELAVEERWSCRATVACRHGQSDPGLTVYEKATCATCRNLFVLLTDRGVDFTRVNYIVDPLSASEIRELLGKAGLRPRDVVRMKEAGAGDLPLDRLRAVQRVTAYAR